MLEGHSVEDELSAAVGPELAAEALKLFGRAEVSTIAAPRDKWEKARSGREYAPARSARAKFRDAPVRSGEDNCTRRQAVLLLMVLEQVWHDPHDVHAPRICNQRLYLQRLAARVGVHVREVQRYLAILRSGGLVDTWQPPVTDATPKSMRGKRHCYSVWRLNRTLPRVLREALRRFQVRAKQAEAEGSPSRGPALEQKPAATARAQHFSAIYATLIPEPL